MHSSHRQVRPDKNQILLDAPVLRSFTQNRRSSDSLARPFTSGVPQPATVSTPTPLRFGRRLVDQNHIAGSRHTATCYWTGGFYKKILSGRCLQRCHWPMQREDPPSTLRLLFLSPLPSQARTRHHTRCVSPSIFAHVTGWRDAQPSNHGACVTAQTTFVMICPVASTLGEDIRFFSSANNLHRCGHCHSAHLPCCKALAPALTSTATTHVTH